MKRYNPNATTDDLIEKEDIKHLYNCKLEEYREKIMKLQKENEFLRERENKLQMIEQMFKGGTVDLSDLTRLVEEK